jgi:L-alanine-DL-glutamate epimerase-like enolase superfamily enzyme
MIDVGNAVNWDVPTAVRTVRRFEEYAPMWVEEPLHPDDWAGLAELRAKTSTLIAHGEREWTPAGYQRLLDTGSVDVFGIDPGRAHGVTGFRKVAEMVGARRRYVNAHAWSSAIISAASLHLSIATPWTKVFEYKPLRNPMQHELVAEPLDPENGWAVPPLRPGLGIDVIEEVVRRYAA